MKRILLGSAKRAKKSDITDYTVLYHVHVIRSLSVLCTELGKLLGSSSLLVGQL